MSNFFDKLKDIFNSLSDEDVAEIKEMVESGEEIDNIIVLNDEEGNSKEFEFLDLIKYEGNEYVVVLPAEDDEDADQVVILMIEEIGAESETYASVDDEDTLQAVFEIFKERNKDEFNFVD